MTPTKQRLAVAALTFIIPLALGGCVTLLPKSQPVGLYRFGGSAQSRPLASQDTNAISVALDQVSFPQIAAGDRIETVDGDHVAYVAGDRWAEPARALFSEMLGNGLGGGESGFIVSPRETTAGYLVEVEVKRFETDYSDGVPTVAVVAHAELIRSRDHAVVGRHDFDRRLAPGGRTIAPIIAAYDRLGQDYTSDLQAFISSKVRSDSPSGKT